MSIWVHLRLGSKTQRIACGQEVYSHTRAPLTRTTRGIWPFIKDEVKCPGCVRGEEEVLG